MILRRLSKHVKDQNWFAVALDFLIVVIGVFVGLQVSNWNAERAERAQERRVIDQLLLELRPAVSTRQQWIASQQARWIDLSEGVMVIQDAPEITVLSAGQCNAIWSSHIVQYTLPKLATLEEILATGRIGALRSQTLRNGLINFNSMRARHADHFAFVRSNYANIVDNYADAMPRRLATLPGLDSLSPGGPAINGEVDCRLDLIRADRALQNQLISNLVRTRAIILNGVEELRVMQELQTTLEGLTP